MQSVEAGDDEASLPWVWEVCRSFGCVVDELGSPVLAVVQLVGMRGLSEQRLV